LVTYTATDAGGNTATCSFTITVTDSQAPSITCPANLTLPTTTGSCFAVAQWAVPTGTDNCGGVVSVTGSALSGSAFGIGTTTVNYVATDVSGNTATCSFTVTVTDNQAPTITCPANQTLPAGANCTAVATWAMPTATDNCGGVATVTGTHTSGSTFNTGTTTVTYTATDNNGNTATCSFTVTVSGGSQNLTLTCPVSQTLSAGANCAAVANWTVPTTTDNCGAVASVTGTHTSGSTFNIGTTTVTYTATAANGTTATCSFTVAVADMQAPTIVNCPTNIAVPTFNNTCIANVVWAMPFATDNCIGTVNLTGSHVSGSMFLAGITTVTYMATDVSGNTATCSFTVSVIDPQPPVITCPASITLNANSMCTATANWANPTATDNCGLPTVTGTHTSGSPFGLGTTNVVFTATDVSGNTATCSFNVTVNDAIAPVITCPANISVAANNGCTANVSWASPTATDNCVLSGISGSANPGSMFSAGITTVVYTATDLAGNFATCAFTVTVTDGQVPTLVCPANQVITAGNACSATVTWIVPSGSDNCGIATVTGSAQPGSTFGTGTTTVTYTATDISGNTATCSFTITVNGAASGISSFACPANISQNASAGTCSRVVNWTLPTATDNCGGVATVTGTHNPGSSFNVGITTVTYTATTASGNTATCSFTVTIADNQAPVIANCPANISVCSPFVTWTPPTATDNCGIASLTSNLNPGITVPIGNTVVNYTATDVNGNTATCSFVITYTQLVVAAVRSNFNGYNVSCNGGNNGTITVSTSGGTAPYTYIWSNGATGSFVSGLTAGNYSVTATDANGCTRVRNVIMIAPPLLNCSATVTNITCAGLNNGSITTTTSGGVAPYTYVWSNGASGSSISGLSAGTYTVTTTDTNGCVCIQSLTVSAAPTASVLTGSVNVYEGGGIIPTFFNVNTINFSGGTAPYNYTWNTSGYVQYSIIAPGQITVVYGEGALWSVTISDSGGCASQSIVLNNYDLGPTPPQQLNIITSSIGADDGTGNGSISIVVVGGHPCAGNTYRYIWSGPSTWTPAYNTNTPNLTGLPSGWYLVTVIDCGPDGIQNTGDELQTIGWYWVPSENRGRSKWEDWDMTADALAVFPNPVNTTAVVSFMLPDAAQAKVVLYDLSGKAVATLYEGMAAGNEEYRLTLDGSPLPAGMYLCRLELPEMGIAKQVKTLVAH
ncbi:MAG TPA: HYR domain-containing protein, partial [Chitinophagales bacterium]|nr:HYR domain-containing protein [Chitinophagales bacterium]